MLACRLFCLHRAALRDAALFKEDFDSGFFLQLVSYPLPVFGCSWCFLSFNTVSQQPVTGTILMPLTMVFSFTYEKVSLALATC